MLKDDVMDMNELDVRISPNPFKVFIYTIEQLEDTNTSRLLQFEIIYKHISIYNLH